MPVDARVTDSIAQVNAQVLGVAPAQAMGTLYQTSAASAGIALQNAVHAQRSQYALNDAATVQAIALLHAAGPAAAAAAATRLDGQFAGLLARLDVLLLTLRARS